MMVVTARVVSPASLALAVVALTAGMAATNARAQTADAAAVGSTTKLPPVTVRAQQDRTSAEITERYNSTQATVGQAAAYLKEIPQSISVVTQQRMEDQSMRNVEEVLEQTVGYASERFDSESAS